MMLHALCPSLLTVLCDICHTSLGELSYFIDSREAFFVNKDDNDIIIEEIRRKILNLAQTFSAVVKVKGTCQCCVNNSA